MINNTELYNKYPHFESLKTLFSNNDPKCNWSSKSQNALNKCVKDYTFPEGKKDRFLYIIRRIKEAVKAIFGRSEWQQTRNTLSAWLSSVYLNSQGTVAAKLNDPQMKKNVKQLADNILRDLSGYSLLQPNNNCLYTHIESMLDLINKTPKTETSTTLNNILNSKQNHHNNSSTPKAERLSTPVAMKPVTVSNPMTSTQQAHSNKKSVSRKSAQCFHNPLPVSVRTAKRQPSNGDKIKKLNANALSEKRFFIQKIERFIYHIHKSQETHKEIHIKRLNELKRAATNNNAKKVTKMDSDTHGFFKLYPIELDKRSYPCLFSSPRVPRSLHWLSLIESEKKTKVDKFWNAKPPIKPAWPFPTNQHGNSRHQTAARLY
ncbi:MAG: hypothetical protein H7A37_03785 [Chlamydiales bacterium]|nr:hypothetical protein [Chlamydiales bacterium]